MRYTLDVLVTVTKEYSLSFKKKIKGDIIFNLMKNNLKVTAGTMGKQLLKRARRLTTLTGELGKRNMGFS